MTQTTSRRQRLINIFAPFFITLITVIITLEVGLRIFYGLIPLEVCAADHLIANYVCQPYFVYDKPVRLAYTYEPGMRFEGMWDPANPFLAGVGEETRPSERNDSFLYVFETDEMGFPNSQHEWQDQYDIIVTGDSFTTRTAPKTWIELLAEQSGQDILTLGASSWTTLNEVEAVKMHGLDKKPKWVILLYFEGNDIVNVGQYLEKQASGLSWDEYDLQGVPFTRLMLTPHLARFVWGQLSSEEDAADTAVADTAVADATVTDDAVSYRYPIRYSTEIGELETVLKDTHLHPLSADYETLAKSDEFRAVSDSLLELKTLVEGQGARLLVVYVPSKEHILWSRIWDPTDVNNILARTVTVTLSDGDSGSLKWQPTYLGYDTFNANHAAQEQIMVDFAAENGFEFLNLTPIFWQETISKGEFYHYADPHWNQAGNQLAADAIFDYISGEEGD